MTAAALDLVRKYRWQFSGMVAQVAQRLTGLLLLLYLFIHVRTVHELAQGPAAFDHAIATFRSPVFRLLEIALLGTVVLHALNGIRMMLIDAGMGHGRQRQLFWIWSVGLGAVVFLAGAIPIFVFSVLRR